MAVSINPEMFVPGIFLFSSLASFCLIFLAFILAYDFFAYQYPVRLLKISFFLNCVVAKNLDHNQFYFLLLDLLPVCQ